MKSVIIHRKEPGTHKPLVGSSNLPVTTMNPSPINPTILGSLYLLLALG
jgi:hypothetical protein